MPDVAMGINRRLISIALAASVASCSVVEVPVIGHPLPEVDTWRHETVFVPDCGVQGAILHGSLSDPRLAWAVRKGQRRELVWPPGARAVFEPGLVVTDRHGNVLARAGDLLESLCSAPGGPGLWQLESTVDLDGDR